MSPPGASPAKKQRQHEQITQGILREAQGTSATRLIIFLGGSAAPLLAPPGSRATAAATPKAPKGLSRAAQRCLRLPLGQLRATAGRSPSPAPHGRSPPRFIRRHPRHRSRPSRRRWARALPRRAAPHVPGPPRPAPPPAPGGEGKGRGGPAPARIWGEESWF